MDKKKLTIAVAGATGFVGKKFCQLHSSEFNIIALTRGSNKIDHCETRKCDLFSLVETKNALKGADIALYLVHSMLPSAKLSQGSFADFDLIAADNFTRACEAQGIKRIIYLGGIIPKDENLSLHLKSRLEVENVLGARSPKLTVLRSGLIIGKGGSTSLILFNLIKRLHVLICPFWTRTPTQAIDISDAVKFTRYCIVDNKTEDKVYDIGSGPPITYRNLLALTALALKKKRYFIDVPFFSPILSYLWLTLISRAPIALTRPIVESLKHPIICKNKELEQLSGIEPISLYESIENLDQEIKKQTKPYTPRAYEKSKEENLVRSVQRLHLPTNWNGEELAKEYLEFLNKHSFGILKVEVKSNSANFRLLSIKEPLLKIVLSTNASDSNRQLFHVRGGLLFKGNDKARLEFRVISGVNVAICGIHDYSPSLPWRLYVLTQAQIHKWVMKKFSEHLKKKAFIENNSRKY